MAKNYTLVDDTKRLPWLTAVVFSDVHGLTPQLTTDESLELVFDVASSQLDVEVMAEGIRLE